MLNKQEVDNFKGDSTAVEFSTLSLPWSSSMICNHLTAPCLILMSEQTLCTVQCPHKKFDLISITSRNFKSFLTRNLKIKFRMKNLRPSTSKLYFCFLWSFDSGWVLFCANSQHKTQILPSNNKKMDDIRY
jgi:hypothetical protein